MLEMLCDEATKQAYETLFGETPKNFADPSFSEAIALSVALVQKLKEPENRRIWEGRSLTGWTIRAAMGKSFQLPVAGTFTISYNGNTTAALAYNATAGAIHTAFNALASVIADGGATVTGQNGYFFFTWTTAGDRPQLTADVTNLAPLSLAPIGTLINGNAGTGLKEVQSLRLLQNPGAYAELTDVSNTPGAPVDVLQVGGGGFNHRIRVRLSPLPYDGRWSIRITGDESGLLTHNISEEDLKTALEAMPSIGAGNVAVFREQEGWYLIGFEGTLANTNMGTIDTNATALKVLDYRSGVLDLRTPGIELLLNGQPEFDGVFEIEATPPTGFPFKVYQQPIKIVSSIIDPATLTPQPVVLFYTAAQIDGFFTGPNWRRKAASGALQIKAPTSGLYYTLTVDETGGVGNAALGIVTPGEA